MLKKVIFISTLFLVAVGFFYYLFIYRYKNERLPQYANTKIKRSTKYLWGEPAKTMFPDISQPKYVSASEAGSFLQDSDAVYVLDMQKGERVYPAKILGFHHIVNDTVDNKPLAVTLCLLSNSAVVYERNKNSTLSFGVLGPLYDGNLVMYDRETDFSWLQLSGEGIQGKYSGDRLQQSAVLIKTTWGKVKNTAVSVLSPVEELPFYENFYKRYDSSTLGLTSMQKFQKEDMRLKPYTNGIGIQVRAATVFIPFSPTAALQTKEIGLDGWHMIVVNQPGYQTPRIFRSYLDGRVLHFVINGNNLEDTETHSQWNANGEAIRGQLKGKLLEKPAYVQSYWFSWAALFPQTEIVK